MNPNICWPDKTLPVEIHCAPEVLTRLEVTAADGLLAMPRTGLGVGGLLLGKRQNGRIEITRSVEIACSHAMGPGFVLTPDEVEAARTMKGHESDVVGWYCSKPSASKTAGPLALNDQDRLLFDALCPQRWQVALLIRPNIGNTTLAAFGMRERDGFVTGEPQELEWPELRPADESVEDPEPVSAGEPEAVKLTIAEVAIPIGGTLFGVPENAAQERAPKKRKWLLGFSIAVIVPAILAAAAYFVYQYLILHPPLALIASSNWRGRVAILWNTQALSGQEKGTVIIDDGSGSARTFHLDRAGLDQGVYEYDCHPGTTKVTLVTDDLSESVTVKVPAQPYLPESGISK